MKKFEETEAKRVLRDAVRGAEPGSVVAYGDVQAATGIRLCGSSFDPEVRRHRDMFLDAVSKEHPAYEAIPGYGVRVTSADHAFTDTRARVKRFVNSGLRAGNAAGKIVERYGDGMGMHQRQLLSHLSVQMSSLAAIARGNEKSLAPAKRGEIGNDSQPILPTAV